MPTVSFIFSVPIDVALTVDLANSDGSFGLQIYRGLSVHLRNIDVTIDGSDANCALAVNKTNFDVASFTELSATLAVDVIRYSS